MYKVQYFKLKVEWGKFVIGVGACIGSICHYTNDSFLIMSPSILQITVISICLFKYLDLDTDIIVTLRSALIAWQATSTFFSHNSNRFMCL